MQRNKTKKNDKLAISIERFAIATYTRRVSISDYQITGLLQKFHRK
ncbi:hypothetical protein MEO93_02675 [Dolichospermum sp. ST_sed3]|nr:hypothetical protein [Dolichospermum sp. ST_sed6]MDD1435996.1 hypothetical protein [Dolichospermum sp. ST_sed10]MDD1439289.1 hypothetical protein [Dolichospermum sp. ST_sed3]MDD1445071.1 hypothetical protein [Dolichospermum sp. ST_sed8]MDD1456068.1 hypothetical protein [Dolichospermum sp. ST_sed7]MDD1459273.1 hypothetical protein [Dolichospermum sp. ST_sed2]MDD1470189.1 hypothetical protein [Dolichospermum sp. ST_sed4]